MSIFAKNKREIRTTPCRLMIRESKGKREGGESDEERTIEGVAIVFGPEYRVTDSYGDTYVEKIAPEAVTADWLKTQDVKLNLLHERDMTIARCNKGVGNLNIWIEKDGVHFSFEAPKCDLGDRALALVRAGVYSGCSFEFYPQDYEVENTKDADGNDVTTVTHTAFEALDALTIAMDPAYEETSVSARELREKIGKGHCEANVAAAEPRPTEPSMRGAAAEPRPTGPSPSSDDERQTRAAIDRCRRNLMMEIHLGGSGLEDILNL